jgi:hypothetical protein
MGMARGVSLASIMRLNKRVYVTIFMGMTGDFYVANTIGMTIRVYIATNMVV